MKKPSKKRANPISVAYPYYQHLIEQMEAQVAMVLEMTQLAGKLRACIAQIERTVRDGRTDNVVRFPERLN